METSYGVSLRVFANSFAFSLISFLQIVEQSILSKSVWQASKSASIAEYSCLMFQGSSFVVFILYSIVASNLLLVIHSIRKPMTALVNQVKRIAKKF